MFPSIALLFSWAPVYRVAVFVGSNVSVYRFAVFVGSNVSVYRIAVFVGSNLSRCCIRGLQCFHTIVLLYLKAPVFQSIGLLYSWAPMFPSIGLLYSWAPMFPSIAFLYSWAPMFPYYRVAVFLGSNVSVLSFCCIRGLQCFHTIALLYS